MIRDGIDCYWHLRDSRFGKVRRLVAHRGMSEPGSRGLVKAAAKGTEGGTIPFDEQVRNRLAYPPLTSEGTRNL